MMQQNSLLESYLRQLKLPTFAQNYAAIASDAARTDLSCERFFNVATLVNDLIVAQHELKLSRLLATLGKQELLVLDEFGFLPFSREGANLLFQLCSALYEQVAVILTPPLKTRYPKTALCENIASA